MSVASEATKRVTRYIPPIRRLLDQRDDLVIQRDVLTAQIAAQASMLEQFGDLVFPPGHFCSPLPSLEEVRSRSKQIFHAQDQLLEIDTEADSQMELVRSLSRFAKEAMIPDHPDNDHRYYFENDWLAYGDGIVLHSILRFLQPSRIVEIGSGFSSALILDTNERDLGGSMRCTFIEPFPDRLSELLRDSDFERAEIITTPLQDVDLDLLCSLRANDVLFIDSSHVSKIGSDVNLLIFQVLPALQKGVFVHFHDIFYPFEYPESWVYQGRGWNEAYILRAYLQANRGYRIRLWNSYLARFLRTEVAAELPHWNHDPGGSLW